MTAVFLSRVGGDLTCQVGRDAETGKPYVCERFAGAFRCRYKGRSGSIYTLPGDTFEADKTSWGEDLVSTVEVPCLRETPVDDAAGYLLELAHEQRLIILYHPQRIGRIPSDDSDLVCEYTRLARQNGRDVLKQVALYHPGLVEAIERRLDEGG